MVFTQFGVAALAVGVVHILEAASRHPPMTKVAASLFFAIAGAANSALQAEVSWKVFEPTTLRGPSVKMALV